MRQSFPVSVLVEYVPTPQNRWQAGRWVVTGVVADPDKSGQGARCVPLHTEGETRQWLWKGCRVMLHKDEAESYYFNIVSETPRIFVVCSIEDDQPLQPLVVSLSYDEAASYMESDQRVESVPMPVELYRFVEQFVLEHYVPEKKKKRKRERWKEVANERPPGH